MDCFESPLAKYRSVAASRSFGGIGERTYDILEFNFVLIEVSDQTALGTYVNI